MVETDDIPMRYTTETMSAPSALLDAERRRFVVRLSLACSAVVAIGLVLALFGYAWSAVFILLGGILLGAILHGAATWCAHKLNIPSRLALAVIVLAGLGSVIGLSLWLWPVLLANKDEFVTSISDAWTQMRGWLESHAVGELLLAELADIDPGQLSPALSGLLGSVAGTVSSILLMVVFGLYFALDPAMYLNGAVRLLPRGSRGRAREIMVETAAALRSWFLGRLLSMALVGVGVGIGLAIAKVPFALGLALFAGFSSFVPNIGPVLGVIPAVLVGSTVDSGTVTWVLIIFGIVQTIESYILTPLIQQRAVSVPPALLLGFQILMGLYAGAVGLLIATPVLVMLIVPIKVLWLRDTLGADVELYADGAEAEPGEPAPEIEVEVAEVADHLDNLDDLAQ